MIDCAKLAGFRRFCGLRPDWAVHIMQHFHGDRAKQHAA
jgi:hypothetical protein